MKTFYSHLLNSVVSIVIGALVTHCAVKDAHAQSVPFNAYSVGTLGGNCTEQGSVMVQSSGGASKCIGAGGNGQALESGGSGADVKWATVPGTGTVTGPATTTPANIAVWNSTTGTAISDSGVALPTGAIVGTTDTQTLTNKSIGASEVNSGTLDAARLPLPTSTAIGGAMSSSAPFNSFATGLTTSGALTYAQPSFSDLSGIITETQIPTPISSFASYETASTVESSSIASTVNMLETSGYASFGDGGGARYIRSASQPSDTCYIQSADGAYWDLQNHAVVNASACGALANGTDIESSLVKALSVLPSSGGTIILPGNSSGYTLSTTLELPSNVTFSGTSDAFTSNISTTKILWNGGNVTAVDARNTSNSKINDISLQLPSAYTGIGIDIGGTAVGQISFGFQLTNSSILVNIGAGGNSICLNANRAIEWTVDKVNFANCKIGVKGADDGTAQAIQSTTATIENSQFVDTNGWPIVCGGNQWNVVYNTFEATYDGKAAAFEDCPYTPYVSVNFDYNWFGDVTASSGVWFLLTSTGNGLSISNNFAGGYATQTYFVELDSAASNVKIDHNVLDTFPAVFASFGGNGIISNNFAVNTMQCFLSPAPTETNIIRYGNKGFSPACELNNLSSNGYSVSPDGTITEWTQASVTGGAITNVNFPFTFPNGCLSAQVSLISPSDTAIGAPYIDGSCTTTSIPISATGPGTSTATVNVLAIGH